MHEISDSEIRARMIGCWLGKAVGGTLGQTFEGQEGPLTAAFYDPVPETMIPNDDLDLQVLWAYLLDREEEPQVSRRLLEQGWLHHIHFPWNEYAVAIRNLREGIHAPESGSFDNWYSAGEGAVIRTEIWACLAPGDPQLAAKYAYEDACVDHTGEGIYAALFMASVQAAAFVENDADRLLDIGLSAIPADSDLARVVTDTRAWHAEGLPWQEVRERILERYESVDMTDVRMNTGFVVLGWLAGADFGERILICNNCGKDTDSSTGSLGSILGIIDPDGIPEEWLAPIGRDLVLNPEVSGITAPPTLDDFTDLVLDLRRRVGGRLPVEPAPVGRRPTGIRASVGFTNFLGRSHISNRFMPRAREAAPEIEMRPTVLDGTWHRMARAEFEDDVLILRYAINIDEDRDVRVMFNTTEQSIAWIDGEYAFARETGSLGEPAALRPGLHEPPLQQFVDLHLSQGVHDLTVAVRRPIVERDAEWVVGCADPVSGMWLVGCFDQVS